MDTLKNKMCVHLKIAGICTCVAATAGCVGLPAVGFGAAGVAASSIAASAQSVFYGGCTCSLFSALQSYGTVGLISKVAGAATVGTCASGLWAAKDGVSWLLKSKI